MKTCKTSRGEGGDMSSAACGLAKAQQTPERILLGVTLLYMVAFVPLHTLLGDAAAALALLPAGLAAWLFSMRVGILTSVLTLLFTLLVLATKAGSIANFVRTGGALNLSLLAIISPIIVLLSNLEARLRRELRERTRLEELYRSVVASMAEGIMFLDADGIVRECNESACRIFGVTPEEVVGHRCADVWAQAICEDGSRLPRDRNPALYTLQTGKPRSNVVVGLHKKEGSIIWMLLNTQPLRRPDEARPHAVVVSLLDITERHEAAEKLRYLSTHDVLTGLYNRAYFEAEMARLQSGRQFPVSVIMADLDGLKRINDSRGHAAGDELLRRAAAMLRLAFRAEDVVARIGGDEFAVLLPHTDERTGQEALARVRSHLAEHNLAQSDLPISLSLGLATAKSGSSLAEAMKRDDQAMDDSKQAHNAMTRAASGQEITEDIATANGSQPHSTPASAPHVHAA